MWCYVCGLSAKNADKAAPTADDGEVDDIFLHNRDWESNEKRCPMYLTQILEVDLNWMGENWEENARDEDFEDDERCLDYLHRFKTIRLLQEVMAKIGNEAFLRAFLAFDSIKNCGYTYDEIISTCTEKLIDRDEFLQNREEENDEEGQEGDEESAKLREEEGWHSQMSLNAGKLNWHLRRLALVVMLMVVVMKRLMLMSLKSGLWLKPLQDPQILQPKMNNYVK